MRIVTDTVRVIPHCRERILERIPGLAAPGLVERMVVDALAAGDVREAYRHSGQVLVQLDGFRAAVDVRKRPPWVVTVVAEEAA